ncbi:MAG: hypothetical protein ABI664_09705 [bacterium]
MHARISHLLVMCGCIALAVVGACKSDTGTNPNNSTDFIPNPSGPVSVGDLVRLNVNGDSSCNGAVYHTARVVAISSKAIILSDTLNPKNGFTTADYQRFATRFDTLVYPLDVANFGEPLDIDKNGHIAILFTRAVNELTPPRANSYVGGFVFSRDLFPNTQTPRAQACAGSNQGEYFYMLAPDPTGVVNGNIRTTAFVDSATVAVLAHEFQHLINATRRLYVNNSPVFEDKWLDEGLAHVAEELLYYRESGYVPRSNLDIAAIRSSSARSAVFSSNMSGNASRYRSYLSAPATNSPYSLNDSLATRGAAWSLLRYTVDRLNATDGFTAGNGQAVTTPGDLTLASGATVGDFTITLANTSLVLGSTATFALQSTPLIIATSVPTGESFQPSMLREPTVEDDPAVLRRDDRFEARLRARERAELTPMMGAARRWYASQNMPVSAALRSRSALASSSFAEADAQTWFRLVNATTAGITNLQSVVGGDLAGFVRDWNVSHAVDDVAAPSTQYQQRSWNWHSIYPNITLPASTYPLPIQLISTSTSVNGTIVAGGAQFYRVVLSAGSSVVLSLSASGGAVNPNLQMVVVRTK